jgi:ubiquinone/menaquinone biosynthesis C-methylase UbiE
VSIVGYIRILEGTPKAMNPYNKYVMPHIINLACGAKPIVKQRQKIVPQARGRVLEVGMGSGLNIPFYDSKKVDFVWGLEPSLEIRQLAAERVKQAAFDIKFIDLPGEKIPLEDNSVDTIVLTYTLCTIPDADAALQQMRRVLKPDGKMLFCEHGEAPDLHVRRWQDRVNPLWKSLCGGCNLNRSIPQLIEKNGFNIGKLEQRYLAGTPKFAGYNYWGEASK